MEAGEEDRERQAPFRRLPTIAQQQLGTVGGTQIFNGLCDAAISSGPLFQSWRTAALDFYVYLACVCRTSTLLPALGASKTAGRDAIRCWEEARGLGVLDLCARVTPTPGGSAGCRMQDAAVCVSHVSVFVTRLPDRELGSRVI